MFSSAKRIYRELPDKFWTLVGASFIDRLGGALIFPFFALYITQHFGVGMTEVGTLFAFFSISSIIGGAIGGALADKYGRKSLIIFSLIMSAGSTVIMGLVDDIKVFYLVAILVGILADTGGPAHQAMVADMLPEEKRSAGFAVLRVTANLAVTIGPMIGGLAGRYQLPVPVHHRRHHEHHHGSSGVLLPPGDQAGNHPCGKG